MGATKWWENPPSNLKIAKWHQFVLFSAPHTYHTKQLNPWLLSSASCMVIYNQLPAFSGEMEPFNLKTTGHSWMFNKPQKQDTEKQPSKLSIHYIWAFFCLISLHAMLLQYYIYRTAFQPTFGK